MRSQPDALPLSYSRVLVDLDCPAQITYRSMMKIERLCASCGKPYLAETKYLARNQGIFCSRMCGWEYQRQTRGWAQVEVTCAFCGYTFKRYKAHLRKSKSGLRFCSRECKDRAQRIGGMKEIQPAHYGNGDYIDYRKLAFETHGRKCFGCGYCAYDDVLEVHHRDKDRTNNAAENLVVLCPTCHAKVHRSHRLVDLWVVETHDDLLAKQHR